MMIYFQPPSRLSHSYPKYAISTIHKGIIYKLKSKIVLTFTAAFLSRSLTMDLIFIFISYFIFIFLFLEQLGLGVISHTVTSVTTRWRSHKTDHWI